ncbi:MAG TPA: YbfB/YjiJ family MFS transporter [Casimicrobium huifangae]|jgi:predicted MFS family arabinose efflux permease|uniref:Major facilitator superfamily MFS_1 n=1 Tax=uncultured bacterium A1Q1_fos_36 TaxID=1256573 RepID=L7W0I6_9BACT|nr:YbfB/YjiJ family MFS transporter [Casimicrobium huifangae]AGC72005.1 major facilitator superfamily MFS_1 [uncultured bacterium A1Q1_fos_36]HOB01703.1 YbfB/YjiJ family MFS transporter [Casimicrobium huifangae]HQA33086.1 YbfB/YjiJ family MFS transporter [Casimicrobium huifangae]HQD64675.1 YbfB/YjiJ family MFS transporter [Casimicrobium huifangae]
MEPRQASPLTLAILLSLAAAVSLGITRFAYGLLLPPMRADLGWTYTLAGSMNTANAFGYFVGALCTPALMRRWDAARVLLVGASLASFFMGASGFFTDSTMLLTQRALAGAASALVFVSGGVLAAKLAVRASSAGQTQQSGLVLGIYYGGSGFGILLSALVVPVLLAGAAPGERWHGYAPWAWAWWVLAILCALATLALVRPVSALRSLVAQGSTVARHGRGFRYRDLTFGLAGYGCFGVGYIGYMTFVIALLREQGASTVAVTVFYSLLGVACMASSRIWAGLLDRHRSGRALATLNALLAAACVLPALSSEWPVLLLSGVVFGGVFLSVVASTTALVRHNLAPVDWPEGIAAFTTVFAAGQIVGPVVVGWIVDAFASSSPTLSASADHAAALSRGLVFSAIALALGALLASRQRALSAAM